MKNFEITEIGAHKTVLIEAHNDYHAVAEAAGCAVNDVALPIWESAVTHPWQPRGQRCYMPLDNTGRQWLVTDARAAA